MSLSNLIQMSVIRDSPETHVDNQSPKPDAEGSNVAGAGQTTFVFDAGKAHKRLLVRSQGEGKEGTRSRS